MQIQKSSLLAVLLTAASAAVAHHSYAAFDQQKNITIEGTVKEVKWTNPHIWIQVLVKDAASGAEVEWSIEGGSPNILTRQGWSRNDLQAGDKLVAVVHPIRSGKPYIGSLARAVANGQRHFEGPDQGAIGSGPAGEKK